MLLVVWCQESCSVSNILQSLSLNSLKASRKVIEELLSESLGANDLGIRSMIQLPLKAMKIMHGQQMEPDQATVTWLLPGNNFLSCNKHEEASKTMVLQHS